MVETIDKAVAFDINNQPLWPINTLYESVIIFRDSDISPEIYEIAEFSYTQGYRFTKVMKKTGEIFLETRTKYNGEEIK